MKGVITAIHYDAHNRQFCTASDDRSVRTWKLKTKTNDSVYSTSSFCLEEVLKQDIHEVLVLYGHSARVWDVLSLKDGSLVSIGEVKAVVLLFI